MGFFFLAQTLFHLFQCTKHSQNSNCPRQSSPEQFQAFLECVNPEQFVLCKLRAGADTLKSQYSILLCYQITSQRGMVTRDKCHPGPSQLWVLDSYKFSCRLKRKKFKVLEQSH